MSSARNEYSKWNFTNWFECNYADSMSEVTKPPTNSHMDSDSAGGSVDNISGTLRQTARDFYNKFAGENTLHRDLTSTPAAEAESAAPTAVAATCSMPGARAAGDYNDNTWPSSPLQTQLPLQLQQFDECLELLSSSSQVESFNTTHSQQQFGTLTHDVIHTVVTTTTQVVDNSNAEVNVSPDAAAALPPSSLSVSMPPPRPLPSTDPRLAPSPPSRTLPIATRDLSLTRGAESVAPLRLRKSVGDAVTRWVISSNAPDSPNVQSRKRKVETQRRRRKSNLDGYDVGTSGDSESDDSSHFMAPPRKKPIHKYHANMSSLRSDAISDDSDGGRKSLGSGHCRSSSSSDDSLDDEPVVVSGYNLRPRSRDHHAARHAFPELIAKCDYINGSSSSQPSSATRDDLSEKHLYYRLRRVALRPFEEPSRSPVLYYFDKRSKEYVPSKSGAKALRTQNMSLIKRRKISCNIAKTETRYEIVDDDDDDNNDDSDSDNAAEVAPAFAKLTALSLGLVRKRGDADDGGAGGEKTMLNGVLVGYTAESDSLFRYIKKLATTHEDAGRAQVQPLVLNHASDHIDYVLSPGIFPAAYINNGMLKMTLSALARGYEANVRNKKRSKHTRTKKSRALKTNVHLREYELELMCLSYYLLSSSDLVRVVDTVRSARLRLLACYNLNSAINCINQAYAKAMRDFGRTHTPRRNADASTFAHMDAASLARYVENEQSAREYFVIDAAAYAELQDIFRVRRVLQVLVDSLLSADSDAIPVEFMYLLKKFYSEIVSCNSADSTYRRHWDLLMFELKVHHFSCTHTQIAIRALTDTFIAVASHTALAYDVANGTFHEYALLRHAAVSEILDGYVAYNPKIMVAYNWLFSHHLYACCKNLANFVLEYYPDVSTLKSSVIDVYVSQLMKNSKIALNTPYRLAKSLTPRYFKSTMARYLWTHIMSRRIKLMQYKDQFQVHTEALDAMMIYMEYEYAVILSRAMLMWPAAGKADSGVDSLLLTIHTSVRDAICRLEEDTVRNLDNVSLSEDRELDGSSRETSKRSAESDISSVEEPLSVKLTSIFKGSGKNLNIVHINAQSIRASYDDLIEAFSDQRVDCILVSESFLKPSLPSFMYSLLGFRLCRNDRVGKPCGGVAVYLRADIPCKVISASPSQYSASAEYLFLEIVLYHNKVLLGVLYSPPRVHYLDTFQSILNDLTPLYDDTLILGDFNTCLLKNNSRSAKLSSIVDSHNLHILSLKATHFQPKKKPSLLDIIIVSDSDKVATHGQLKSPFSFHDLIYLSYKIRSPKCKTKFIETR